MRRSDQRMAGRAAAGAAILGGLLCSSPARASEASEDEKRSGFDTFAIGAEGGVLLPAAVHVKSTSFDTSAGPFAQIYGDLIAGRYVSFGFAGIFANTKLETGDAATVFDFAATIKGRFDLSKSLQLRPGFTFGYQLIAGDFEDVRGFDPGLTISIALRTSESTAIVIDGGFISQPLGGNRDVTVTFYPMAYAALGLELGK